MRTQALPKPESGDRDERPQRDGRIPLRRSPCRCATCCRASPRNATSPPTQRLMPTRWKTIVSTATSWSPDCDECPVLLCAITARPSATTSSTAAHPGCSTTLASTRDQRGDDGRDQRGTDGVQDRDAADHPVRRDRLVDRPAEGVGQRQRDQRERGDRTRRSPPVRRPSSARYPPTSSRSRSLRRHQPRGGQQPADCERRGEVEDRLHRRQRRSVTVPAAGQARNLGPGRHDRGQRQLRRTPRSERRRSRRR